MGYTNIARSQSTYYKVFYKASVLLKDPTPYGQLELVEVTCSHEGGSMRSVQKEKKELTTFEATEKKCTKEKIA